MNAGLYRHYKGDYYVVIGVAQQSTNGEGDDLYVVYMSLEKRQLRVRKFQEFVEDVDGHPRFRYVGGNAVGSLKCNWCGSMRDIDDSQCAGCLEKRSGG